MTQLLRKMGADARTMARTIMGLPHETRRAMLIVGTSLMIIGVLVFWPDIPASIGFAVVTVLLMCAFMALSASGVRATFDDGSDSPSEFVETTNDNSGDWV